MCRCGHSYLAHTDDQSLFGRPDVCSACSCNEYTKPLVQEPLPLNLRPSRLTG